MALGCVHEHRFRYWEGGLELCARCEIERLEALINRWQGMITRQVLDVSAKCAAEMQTAITKEATKTDVLT